MKPDMMSTSFLQRIIRKSRTHTHTFKKYITEYYIIPVDNAQNHFDAQENYIGPLTKEDFDAKRKELGVSDDITFERL